MPRPYTSPRKMSPGICRFRGALPVPLPAQMPRFSPPQKTWQLIVLVVAVAATIIARWNRQLPHDNDKPLPEKRTPSAQSSPKRASGWQVLRDCKLADDRTNDGDSFSLRCGGETYTFRLYFADCPEKYRHQYNGERLAQQGTYFGGLNEEETIAIGVQAKEFALGLLAKGPVTVETRWEGVYNSERMYAFVRIGNQDLAEALISRGLARIHTSGAARIDGTTERAQKDRLYQLEREAKSQRRGAWGAQSPSPSKRR